MRRAPIIASFLLLGVAMIGMAQTKPRLTPADYSQWEIIGLTALSPDGKWLAYGVSHPNRDYELRIKTVAGGDPRIVAFGTRPVFASNSHWIAYAIGYSEAQEEKLRKDKKPVHRKLGLLNLATGQQEVFDGVDSFSFSANGAFLAMRRYRPERKDAPPPEPATELDAPPGAALIVRQLSTSRDTASIQRIVRSRPINDAAQNDAA